MPWIQYFCCFLGASCVANAVPHFVNGISGRAFQTPFAKPPGKGLSSSTVNVLWAFVNFAAGYLLMYRVGRFDPGSIIDLAAAVIGALVMSLMLATYFGRFHGGNAAASD